MTDMFDDELRRSLHTQADRIPRIPDLSRGAIRQARDIRRHRRIARGVAAAALIAVALPVGLKVGDAISKTSREPEPVTPDGPKQVQLDLQTLSAGDEPAVPYLDGRTIVGDGFEIDVPGKAPIAGIAPVDDGVYVATGDGGAGWPMTRYSTNGDVEGLGTVLNGPVASTDGRWVAYLTGETDEFGNSEGPATLVLMDDDTGEESSVTLPATADAYEVAIHAVADGTVYLSYDDRRSGRAVPMQTWSAGDPALVPVPGDFDTTAVSPDGNVVAELTKVTDFGACSAVVDRATESVLWRTCDYMVNGFTPDGDYVWAVPSNSEGYGPSAIAILDAATGDLVRHYEPAARFQHPITFVDAVFEDDEHLLIQAEQDDGTALLRCEVLTEKCKTAEPLVQGTGMTGRSPYLLADVR
jgi:hypothetical protein